ncbi:hypothetical protein EDD36DRAFT_466819 [Exophiala viscosa]|uniref:DUF4185 domain-containing protein n=1 Tax=Exophiala viscosa TaxID=2486360 RepID=A0AAN6DSG9_9EURO|nr:hypothetical protein EDD36DRAFT_466819 [Exophiala viscosa]
MYSIKLCFFFLSTTFITGSLATPLHKHFHHHHGTGFHHFCTTDGSGDVACSFPNGVETTFAAESATSIATDASASSLASVDAIDSTLSLTVVATVTTDGLSASSDSSQSTPTVTLASTSDVTSTASPADVSSASSAATSTSTSTQSTSTETTTSTSTSVSEVTSTVALEEVSTSSSTLSSSFPEASTSTSTTTTTSASVIESTVAAAVVSSSSSTSTTTSPEGSTSTFTTTLTTLSTTTSTSTTTSASATTSAEVAAVSVSRSAWSSTSTTSSQSTSTASTTTAASTSTSTSTSASTVSKSTSTTTASSSSSSSSTNTASGTLPAPSQFKTDNGTKWTVEYVGEIGYTGPLASQGIIGDKCRTSKIGDQIMWNCGDMECGTSYTNCGFSMGAGFLGTDDVMTINATSTSSLNANTFVAPWSNDPSPESPWSIWGMDTSNVAAINDTHGVAYAWEIWRGASDGSISNRGNAVASITIGDDGPVATRVGPLLTGSDSIALGLLAILADGGYIYTYSVTGPTNLQIGRVAASDDVFDASKYEFLAAGSNDTWIAGIPSPTDTSVAATTANTSGSFGCGNYGSVFFNSYLNKYVILCDIFESFVNMYVADNPWGPWSAEYGIQGGGMIEGGYGSMAHPEYAVDGDTSGKSFYYSLGPNGLFYMFKLTFDY